MNTNFDYIDSDQELSAFCDRILSIPDSVPLPVSWPWIAVDTEFMRERTYYAELSLVQIASPWGNVLVDPLSITDLSPLSALMKAPGIAKIFHSPDQDLEVLSQTLGVFPQPLFDTQLASALLGQGDQIGYAGLVNQLLGIELSKGQTRTNWHQRPLTSAQLKYAELDVLHLHAMVEILKPQLEAKGRLGWMDDEVAAMIKKQQRAENPDNAWQRLKGGGRLPPQSQQVAKALAVWKEARAQKRNLPREWVLKKNVLLELARKKPQTRAQLKTVSDLSDKAIRGVGDQLLKVINSAMTDDAERVWDDTDALTVAQRKQVKAISTAVREKAESESILPALIINRMGVERIVRGQPVEAVLNGWRLALVGEEIAGI